MERLASFLTQALRPGRGIAGLAFAVTLAFAMCSPNALAQSGAGSIQGTVTDSTGAVIPGATIHVVNQATGVAIGYKNQWGWVLPGPGLNTGPYVLTITAAGMETYKRTSTCWSARTFVADASLTAGAVTTEGRGYCEHRATA